jgi:hypothetical protein
MHGLNELFNRFAAVYCSMHDLRSSTDGSRVREAFRVAAKYLKTDSLQDQHKEEVAASLGVLATELAREMYEFPGFMILNEEVLASLCLDETSRVLFQNPEFIEKVTGLFPSITKWRIYSAMAHYCL